MTASPHPYSPRAPISNEVDGAFSKTRGSLVLFGIAYLLFVIYGSLVPLTFRPMSFDLAVTSFKAIPYLSLGIQSRADWVANLLLFIPLAFFWMGALCPHRQGFARVFASLALCVGCVGLSVAIEFVQIFFPPRTVSINDIAAESIGGLLGVLLWCLTGARFQTWLGSLRLVRGTAGVAERLLVVYLLVMLGYSLLPLDLTLSVVELYHKWNEGRIQIIPFSAKYEDTAHMIYDRLSDVAIWIPAALLWKLAYRQSNRMVWLRVVAAAAVIEALQLFVYSRVTDTTDVLTAAIGGVVALLIVGNKVGNQISTGYRQTGTTAPGKSIYWFAVFIWLGVLTTVFWYPFDFNFDRSFVHERLLGLKRVPFKAYYFGSEFRAVTEVLHKTLFMLPLGIFLGLIAAKPNTNVMHIAPHAAMVILIFLTAIGIEAGQVFLPLKNADITDVILEITGAILGYGCCLFTLGLLHQPSNRLRPK